MAQIIDGKAIAAQVRAEVKAEVDAWVQAGNRPPYLAVILVGDNPASASYVRGKTKAAAEVGIASDTLHFDTSISEAELLAEIARLNEDDGVDGILVQLPLPDHISPSRVLNAIRPDKDVDGFHPVNAGRLLLGEPGFVPATPAGILELLRRSGIETTGKHAVVVGRSNIVGRPLAALLLHRGIDATVTVCHSRTRDLAALTRTADILVAAIGRPRYITADMVREGAVVIDVGINRVDDPSHPRGYRLVGDVDFEAVVEKAGWITPVPGGVGPMTIALLLRNTLYAAQRRYTYA
ncbi:bifunctional methylenetetrahydrofolate dehydrogenase/methenyltetrahydrofolate cyclohydrolase FolD [Rhodothermus marinus]|uniref:bifunctional methylenetetrahydrofolate dehydrogenase/methenyltetrahydrofolate cyclohydrolase FolD n=1 Tax=Rhodothermus marinus TaxID=29549 RepID=UPI0006CFE144|nr:bifunctional methylenetetrahydrofolate dehydrogenase/methenyltetrahydrofolate cyclohydrolase FolD [Rhodothermus marinus]